MATVRPATLPPRVTEFQNVTLTDTSAVGPLLTMLSDNKTLVYSLNSRIFLSTNYATSYVSGDLLADSTWDIRGLIETPGGEVIVSLHKNNTAGPSGGWSDTAGYALRSTGWNPATGHATTWTQVLTTSGPGCYLRSFFGFNNWGIAPAWSQDAGAIFVSEYGPHTTEAATPAQSGHLVWRSDDDGQTWRAVFNLLDHYDGATQQVHLHAVCYDPWDGRVYVTHGDGGSTPAGVGAVFYSDSTAAGTPTWTEMPEFHETTGFGQVTSIAPFEAGLILLSDGGPNGAKLLPRRGYRRMGTHVETTLLRKSSSTPFIGAAITRRGGLADPQPSAPIFMGNVEPSSDQGNPVVWVSTDGRSIREAYRYTAATADITLVTGPDVNGKVVASISTGGKSQTLIADYQPARQPDLGPSTDAQSLWAGGAAETFPRWSAQGIGLVSGTIAYAYFTALSNVTITKLGAACRTVAGAGLTLARYGLYLVDPSTDVLTLVARIASDTTLFAATGAYYERALDTTGGYPASYQLVAGQRYALGVLCVGTTMPTILGNSVTGPGAYGLSPKLTGSQSGQSDLPTTVTAPAAYASLPWLTARP